MLLHGKWYLTKTCLFLKKIYTDKQRQTCACRRLWPKTDQWRVNYTLTIPKKRPREHSTLTAVTRYCAYIYVIVCVSVCAFVTKGCQRIQPCKENLIKTLYSHKGQSTPSFLLSFNHGEHFSWKSVVYSLSSSRRSNIEKRMIKKTRIKSRLHSIDLHSWTRNNESKLHNGHGVSGFCNHMTESFEKYYLNISTSPMNSQQYQHWLPGLGYIVWFIRLDQLYIQSQIPQISG